MGILLGSSSCLGPNWTPSLCCCPLHIFFLKSRNVYWWVWIYFNFKLFSNEPFLFCKLFSNEPFLLFKLFSNQPFNLILLCIRSFLGFGCPQPFCFCWCPWCWESNVIQCVMRIHKVLRLCLYVCMYVCNTEVQGWLKSMLSGVDIDDGDFIGSRYQRNQQQQDWLQRWRGGRVPFAASQSGSRCCWMDCIGAQARQSHHQSKNSTQYLIPGVGNSEFRDAYAHQNGWIFGRLPNALWPTLTKCQKGKMPKRRC